MNENTLGIDSGCRWKKASQYALEFGTSSSPILPEGKLGKVKGHH
jgi:hypothetical protein